MTSCHSSEGLAQRIRGNVERIRERVEAACRRAGRHPSEVSLIAVTKTWGPEVVLAAREAGLRDFGENYAQELARKAEALRDAGIRWHFIGALQTNKVKGIVSLLSSVHSVDRPSLVLELGRRIEAAAQRPADRTSDGPRALDVFVEVNLARESQKSGVSPDGVLDLCRLILDQPVLRLKGLMCVPPIAGDPEGSRRYFQELRALRERVVRELAPPPGVLSDLSMGMSHDFEVAIEEGATVIRIGTALFGARPVQNG